MGRNGCRTTELSPVSAGARVSPGEQGYVLLFFLFLAAVLVIGLYRVLPEAAFEAQREKEQELIFRGMQYQRAIRLFVRQFGRYPASLDDLTSTNNMRFIRKLYADPMTKDGQWRLIHMGPGGVLLDSINPPVPNGCPANSVSSSGSGNSAAVGNGSNSGNGSDNSNGANDSNSSNNGSGSNGCPSAIGATSSSATSGSNGSTSGSSFSSSSGSSPFTTPQPSGDISGQSTANPSGNQAPGQNQTANGQNQTATSGQPTTSGLSGQPQPFGSGTITGPIAGVASKSESKSIRVWNTYTHYNQWEFIYNYLSSGVGAATPATTPTGTSPSSSPTFATPANASPISNPPASSGSSGAFGTSSSPQSSQGLP